MSYREHAVIGPPGTGKTTYLADQVNKAVKADKSPMVISLTKAAAKEAAGRDMPIPRENVSTLHAQAYRSLNSPVLADTPEGIKEWNTLHPWLTLTQGIDVNDPQLDMSNLSTHADEMMLAWQCSRARMEPAPPESKILIDKWIAWKTEREILDFTDTIETALSNVETAPGDPTVIFADEAQDLSVLEIALIRKWSKAAGHLVVVGDPWQCLYQWRGTDPSAMPKADVILSESYRIPKVVHERAISWMEQMPKYEPIEYSPRDAEGEIRKDMTTWNKPQFGNLMRMVRADIDAGKTVMLLASCNYMLQPMVSVLREKGIPFHNPYRLHHGGWNPLKRGSSTVMSATERVLAFLRPSLTANPNTISKDGLIAWTHNVSKDNFKCKKKDIKEAPCDNNGIVPYEWVAENFEDEILRRMDVWRPRMARKQPTQNRQNYALPNSCSIITKPRNVRTTTASNNRHNSVR